jgi:AcrR family transcriptional regulator
VVALAASEEPPPTPKGRRTRAALLKAAREVFETRGFADTRIAEITARAGTSYGTFYTYFPDREAVFREVVQQVTGQIFDAINAAGGDNGDPVDRIARANRAYLRAYAENARLMAVLEQMSPYSDYFRELTLEIRRAFVARNEAGIRRLQEQGVADPHLDPHVAASALGGMVEKLAQVWLVMGESYDEEDVVSALTRIWAQGIGLAVPPPAPSAQPTQAGRRRSAKARTPSRPSSDAK